MREITGSNVEQRVVRSYDVIAKKVVALRELGYTIGLTSGTWDLKHIGHDRYLERLKEKVNVVVVGVDSDEKTRRRKGSSRPLVPELERLEALCHVRHVDLVFLKGADDEPHQLIKTVRPDVLLLSTRTGKGEEEVEAVRQFCGDIMILESQAETSTSARVRRLHIDGILEAKKLLDEGFARLLGGDHG